MRFFLDTEFIDDPVRCRIDLISIAISSEDGRSYYAVSLDFDPSNAGDWVKKNVLPKLPPRPDSPGRVPTPSLWKTRAQIKAEILEFVGRDAPEFWGYFADYDWVAFCWLFGSMENLPKHFPMYCRDIKQLMDSLGVERIPFNPDQEHDARSDAEWNRKAFTWLMSAGAKVRRA